MYQGALPHVDPWQQAVFSLELGCDFLLYRLTGSQRGDLERRIPSRGTLSEVRQQVDRNTIAVFAAEPEAAEGRLIPGGYTGTHRLFAGHSLPDHSL